MCLGIPAQIVAIEDAAAGLALVDSGGVRRQADISCLILDQPSCSAEKLLGRWVILHVGFALALIDEAEARDSLKLIAQLDPASEEGLNSDQIPR